MSRTSTYSSVNILKFSTHAPSAGTYIGGCQNGFSFASHASRAHLLLLFCLCQRVLEIRATASSRVPTSLFSSLPFSSSLFLSPSLSRRRRRLSSKAMGFISSSNFLFYSLRSIRVRFEDTIPLISLVLRIFQQTLAVSLARLPPSVIKVAPLTFSPPFNFSHTFFSIPFQQS